MASALRDELQGLRTMQLHARAAAVGVGDELLEDAMDSPQPKAALIELLLQRGAGNTAQKPRPEPEPEPEPEADAQPTSGSAELTPQAGRIVAALAGDKAQRETAYSELNAISDAVFDSAAAAAETLGSCPYATALGCAGPLVETVLNADVSVVDAAEFSRAATVLASLYAMDPAKVGVDYFRSLRFDVIWGAPNYVGVLDKEPSELSRQDALALAAAHACDAAFHAKGFDAGTRRFVADFLPVLMDKCAWFTLTSRGAKSDAWIESISRQLLDVVREPRAAARMTVAGAWLAIAWALSGRETLCVRLLEDGLLDVAVASLRRTPPSAWQTWRTLDGVCATTIFCVAWNLNTVEFSSLNKTTLLISKGFVDVFIDSFKAFERQGASKLADASVCSVWCPLCVLATLVSRHDIAAIWVAFFSRWQRYRC